MTTATLSAPAASAALERVNALLDLSNVRAKFTDAEEGKGHGPERLDLMEAETAGF